MASLSPAVPLLPPCRRPSRPARALRLPPRTSTALLTLLAGACAPSPALSAAPPPNPPSHHNNSSSSPPTALRTDPPPSPTPRALGPLRSAPPSARVMLQAAAAPPSAPPASPPTPPDEAPSPAGGPLPASPRPAHASPSPSDLALPRLLPCPSPDACVPDARVALHTRKGPADSPSYSDSDSPPPQSPPPSPPPCEEPARPRVRSPSYSSLDSDSGAPPPAERPPSCSPSSPSRAVGSAPATARGSRPGCSSDPLESPAWFVDVAPTPLGGPHHGADSDDDPFRGLLDDPLPPTRRRPAAAPRATDPNGKARPIAIGDALEALAGRCMLQAKRPALREYFSSTADLDACLASGDWRAAFAAVPGDPSAPPCPDVAPPPPPPALQLAFAPAGTDLAHFALQALYESGGAIFGHDGVNTFNTISREAAADALRDCPVTADLLPAYRLKYGRLRSLRYHRQPFTADGVVVHSCLGPQQGCTWGTLVCALVHQRALTLATLRHPGSTVIGFKEWGASGSAPSSASDSLSMHVSDEEQGRRDDINHRQCVVGGIPSVVRVGISWD
ncbi:hypothetical protein AB1Y20_010818 [Prymnesium parvum]|uniref:Uncharacterized protein n=1 Tax=Prymnesium parvum TaxID=97485 RepID=A0AB34IQS3_PRYPA